MKRNTKIILGVAIFLVLGIISIIVLNSYLKGEIENALGNEYSSSELSYEDISINILGGSAVITNLKITEGAFTLESPRVSLDGFSYSDYLSNDNITIGSVHLQDPKMLVIKSDTTSNKSDEGQDVERLIRVKKFSTSGGSFQMKENDSADNSIYASLQTILIREIVVGKLPENTSLPFKYETLNFETDSLFYNLNQEHTINVDQVNFNDTNLKIKGFLIIPKYSREGFDRNVPYEKDWIALRVDDVHIEDLRWEKSEDDFLIRSPAMEVDNAKLQIYRNKMLPDDTRIKPMYSQMLRDLGVKLHLEKINIKNANIEYEENILESRPPAKLTLQNVSAGIENLTNYNMEAEDFPVTSIKATAQFMGQSNVTINWEFDVSNTMDEFRVSGNLQNLNAEALNPFLRPAMNIETEGSIESLNYNFYGNRNAAKGDMKLSYRDFKVSVLKDGEAQKRSLLSGLANLILKNDRIDDDVQNESIETTRDKTKSFWNFLWLCIRDGALSTFF
ncbi:hypothetical protein BH23BAC2_BH23BAC2_19320 [soil metagenome]